MFIRFFFLFNKIFYLIFFLHTNVYHEVTRQSFGITKLYTKEKSNISFQEKYIYFFNFFIFYNCLPAIFLEIDISEYKILSKYFCNYFTRLCITFIFL